MRVDAENLKIVVLAIVLLGWGAHSCYNDSWVNYDRNETVRSLPHQSNTVKRAFGFKGFMIVPLADFAMEGRVLSKEAYFFGKESRLVPVDLALGWGPMSAYRVLKDLKISQSGRWYEYTYKEPPILPGEMAGNSANMHLIPANAEIKRKIKNVRRGEIVAFKGSLVQAYDETGWRWTSSLSRSDTGEGACELVWVEKFDVK